MVCAFKPEVAGHLRVFRHTTLLGQLSERNREISGGPFDPISDGIESINFRGRTNGHDGERIFDKFNEPSSFGFSFLFATTHLAY